MILAKGKLYGEEEREVLLARLEDEINETRVRAPLRSETVIAALDALGRHIENGQFDAQLAALGLSRRTDAVRTATAMLRRENLEYRLHMELGMHLGSEYPLTPPNGSARRICRAVPLGTVLHIAAGNADGLPVLSLAEGLLTGICSSCLRQTAGFRLKRFAACWKSNRNWRIISISSTRLPVMLLRCKGWQPYATASLRGEEMRL